LRKAGNLRPGRIARNARRVRRNTGGGFGGGGTNSTL